MNEFHLHQTTMAVEEIVDIFLDDPPRLSSENQDMDDLYMTIRNVREHSMRDLLFRRIVWYTLSNKKESSEQLKNSTFLLKIFYASILLRG